MLFIGVTIGWIHIMAVAIAVGGSYFMNFIIDKAAEEMPPAEGGKLKGTVGPLFGKVASIMTLLIVVTGVGALESLGSVWHGLWQPPLRQDRHRHHHYGQRCPVGPQRRQA